VRVGTFVDGVHNPEDFDEPRGESTAYSAKCLFELPRTRLLLAIYTQRRTCAL
jgi:hypothetical protein